MGSTGSCWRCFERGGAFWGQDLRDFFGLTLKTEMAEGESAVVLGPTRLPASRVASLYRCNRCEPGSLVEPSTTPSSSLSISVSRLTGLGWVMTGVRCVARCVADWEKPWADQTSKQLENKT